MDVKLFVTGPVQWSTSKVKTKAYIVLTGMVLYSHERSDPRNVGVRTPVNSTVYVKPGVSRCNAQRSRGRRGAAEVSLGQKLQRGNQQFEWYVLEALWLC